MSKGQSMLVMVLLAITAAYAASHVYLRYFIDQPAVVSQTQNMETLVATTSQTVATMTTPQTQHIEEPIATTTVLRLTYAHCGNWSYVNAKDPDSPNWITKRDCTKEILDADETVAKISYKEGTQSVVRLTFVLDSSVDASQISSVEGRVVGYCQRQFEMETKRKRGDWKQIGFIKCPPGYTEDIDQSFIPEIHNGKAEVLIVSGDPWNQLGIDQISVTAKYFFDVATSTPQQQTLDETGGP